MSEVTLLLSRRLSATRSGRNPTHAGGGPVAGANAGLPAVEAPWRSCSSNVSSEERQPALNAGMRKARSNPPLSRPGKYKQRVNLGDGQTFGTGQDLHDLVAGFDLALFEDAKIKARPVMRHHERRHLRLVHSDAEPVAGDARLRHLEQRASNPVMVADAHLCVGQAVDREVLAELTVNEVSCGQAELASSGTNRSDKQRPRDARRRALADRLDHRRRC